MILLTGENDLLEDVIRDFKSYTSRRFYELLVAEKYNYESRKKWMLNLMKDKLTTKYQFWQNGNYPIEL